MRPLRGFATLTAMALMVLLAAYLALGATASAQVELGLNRAAAPGRADAWLALDHALKALKETWDPTKQTFAVWAGLHTAEGLTWASLSGRVNLNTVSPFVLGLTGFRDTLKGVSVEAFTEKRSLKGPSADGALYQNVIQPEALKNWYTVHSLWNLNTADEVMLEAMATQRAGSAVGSALRASVRSFREQTKRITPDDWSKMGGAASILEPLVTLDPELDVNEAPEDLLSALISNPGWAVAEPAGKVQTIVQGRASQPWTMERLKTLLQVPDNNLVLSYLGVRTRFIGGSVRNSGGSLDFVLFLAGETPTPVAPRIVQALWRKS